MSGKRKPWHSGQFARLARLMRQAATARRATRCWRDGHTIDQHPTGERWTCGHVDDIELFNSTGPHPLATWITGSDGIPRLCAPEVSGCNHRAGATHGNRMRSHTTTRNW